MRRMLPDYYSRRLDMRYAVLQGCVHSGHCQWRCAGSVLLCWAAWCWRSSFSGKAGREPIKYVWGAISGTHNLICSDSLPVKSVLAKSYLVAATTNRPSMALPSRRTPMRVSVRYHGWCCPSLVLPLPCGDSQ